MSGLPFGSFPEQRLVIEPNDYRTTSFLKSSAFNMLSVHSRKGKDGVLMWTKGLTVKTKLCFQIFLAYSAGTGPETEIVVLSAISEF